MLKLTEQFAAATRSLGFRDHIATGNVEAHARSAKPAAVSGSYRLSELLPALLVSAAENAAWAGQIDAVKAGKSTSIGAGVMERSRVAQAGAQLIVVGTEVRKVEGAPGIVYANEGSLRLVKPAPFAELVDGADVTVSAYPIGTGRFKMDEAPSSAVRFEIGRRQQKDQDPALLTYELSQAITLGLAHEMDRILLAAITADSLAPFSFGAAAAKGLAFNDLRALVGTAGTGAAVSAAGVFTASGVPAEMTDTTASTVFGAFATAGVAVLDDLQIHVERLDVNGTMAVTIFINALPVIADPALFFEAA